MKSRRSNCNSFRQLWLIAALLVAAFVTGQPVLCLAADSGESTSVANSTPQTTVAGPWVGVQMTWGELFCTSLMLCVALAVGKYLERRQNRKQVEREATQRETEKSRKQLHRQALRISEAVPLGVFELNEMGECLYVNAAWQTITGLTLPQSLGCGWKQAIAAHERDHISELLTRSACQATCFSRELQFHNAHDGQSRWVQLKANPCYGEHGILTVITVEDVTARKMVSEELQRAKEAAVSAALSKSEFLANMSHEIRTPMTSILGYADILLVDPGIPEQAHGFLRTIRRNGEFLLEILNDILDISKIEAGKLACERLVFSLPELLQDVQSLMQVRAAESGLTLEVKIDGPVPEKIQSDPTRLRQILINLVGNALKFTSQGSVQIIARMTPAKPIEGIAYGLDGTSEPIGNSQLEISVIDSGIGMNEQQIARLFRPFTQADSSTTRNFGGTGLGLAISRRLARLLGGDISVTSEPGVGSVFRTTVAIGSLEGVKLISSLESVPPTEIAHVPASSPPQIVHGTRILLAEDGVDNQRLISFLLRKAGADVTIAENGQVAMQQIQSAEAAGNPFDLVLMDMQMPILDGYAATSALRNEGYTGRIVALTAHALSTDREKCLAAGCDDFASKPIVREQFFQTVLSQLEKSRAAKGGLQIPAADITALTGSAVAQACSQ